MFSNNAAMMMSPHRDVLEAAIPDTDDSKTRLLEELKSRARTCVSQKSWMDAKLLYEKAIAVDPTEAPLHSNLSLVQYSMGKFQEAKEAAEKAVALDPKYVKGHWRLAQALCKLEDYDKALKVHQTALVQDPTNKAIKKEIESCKKLADEKRAKDLAAAEAFAKDEERKSEPVEPLRKSTTATPSMASKSTTKVTSASNDTADKMDIDDDDGAEFTKSDHVKGYKIVNGKKTSFFHNELDEKTKELIGDIAPKRIEVTSLDAPPAPVPGGGSAWNKAGTWEEKDVTVWAKDTIQERLLAASYTLPVSSPAPGATCSITGVPTCDGHASFAMVRGKKRYIYEFGLKVKWQFSVEEDTASGTMTFPDFDGTCELGDGYDMTDWEVKDSTSSQLTPLLERFVKSAGLRDVIHHTLDDWVRNFRETY